MPNQAGIDDHTAKAEELAAGYKSINRREAYPDLYAMAERAQANGESLNILDIGCGSGVDAFEMAKLGHHVVGIEPSGLRDIAIRDHSDANIEYRDGLLPELASVRPDEKFDLVVLSTVWQYLDPAERVDSLKRIAETMKPNAKLILSYPFPPSRTDQFEVSPEEVAADIRAANASLPRNKQLASLGEPNILPDTRARKGTNGEPIQFYNYTFQTGHTPNLGERKGWAAGL